MRSIRLTISRSSRRCRMPTCSTSRRQAEQSARASEKGAIIVVPGIAFGDIALVPALWKKEVHAASAMSRSGTSPRHRGRDYVHKVFEGQCAIGLQNLERLTAAVGDAVQASFVTGTDFGTQAGLFISRKAYRELYMPFHKIINGYIHAHSRRGRRSSTPAGVWWT